MTDKNRGNSVRRRKVLKGMSVAGFSGGLSSVTAADRQDQQDDTKIDSEIRRELEQMAQEYSSEEKVRDALTEIGTPLLRTLEREGFINNHTIESLPIRDIITPEQHTIGEDDGVMVVGVTTPEGPTARIQVVKKNESYKSVLTIDVHTEEARALVRNRDDPAESAKVVSTDGTNEIGALCTAGSYCKEVVEPDFSYPCYNIEVKCCFSQDNCTDISELGSECTEGTCYTHCLFACGICEDGTC